MLHVFSDGDGTRLYSPAGLLALAAARRGQSVPTGTIDMAALESLCAAFEAARPRQTAFGKLNAQATLIDALVKRLRLADAPECLADIPATGMPGPIFIVAPFRTGTTFLHRLLSQDPATQWPRVWEVAYAPPAESDDDADDPRIAQAAAGLRTLHRASPALSRLHPMAPDLAEECFGLLETSLLSHSFMFQAELPSYLDWLDARDDHEWRAAYEIYAAQLRLLHERHPGQRWVLKSPVHLWNLEALLAMFPAAHVVQLHREPAATMRSFCRLMAAHRAATWRAPSPAAIGAQALDYMRKALARAVAARQAAASWHFIDIGFDDLMRDPMASVRTIYARTGAPLTPDTAARISQWLSQATRESAADLSGEDFGLDDRAVRAAFAGYSAFLDGPHERRHGGP